MDEVKLTLAMLKDGYFENAFVRTSSFTSFPRSPQNKRKSSVDGEKVAIVNVKVLKNTYLKKTDQMTPLFVITTN